MRTLAAEDAAWQERTSRLLVCRSSPGASVASDNNDTYEAERRWRALAAEARLKVEALVDPGARILMLEIAKRYEQLAMRARQRRQSNN